MRYISFVEGTESVKHLQPVSQGFVLRNLTLNPKVAEEIRVAKFQHNVDHIFHPDSCVELNDIVVVDFADLLHDLDLPLEAYLVEILLPALQHVNLHDLDRDDIASDFVFALVDVPERTLAQEAVCEQAPLVVDVFDV